MKKCFVGMMLAFFVMAGVISASFPAYAEEEMKAVLGCTYTEKAGMKAERITDTGALRQIPM